MPIRLKQILSCLLCFAFLMLTSGVSADASDAKSGTYIKVVGFDESVDYSKQMKQCAEDGSIYALQMGSLYEEQRNLKIDMLKLGYEKTSYFTDFSTGTDILSAMSEKTSSGSHKSERISRMKSEYEAAGLVYEYLNQKGFSDAVIAGILGNMMAECGGQTLSLQWNIYGGGGSYYGLCQWSLYYCPEVSGRGVTGQLDYLMGNLEKNMGYFGGNYNYFCSMTDAGEAARYFCNYYERGSGENTRANNAYAALKWING